MLNIETKFTGRYAFLHTGFRPFFLLSASAAALLMVLWFFVFGYAPEGLQLSYSPVYWHAHEMLFGFALATIAGFLLTAVRNWTGRTTLVGKLLLLLALPWLLARIFPFFSELSPLYAGAFEALFLSGLAFVIIKPVVMVKQWEHISVVGKVGLLIPASVAFHLGLAGIWPAGTVIGLYAAFYILLALVITLARRVMPMFIERGLNNGFVPRNHPWADRWGLGVFLLFTIVDTALLALPGHAVLSMTSAILAAILLVLHGARLQAWYHRGIWAKPLVWVLFVAYAWIVFGFLLKAVLGFGLGNHSLAIHAFSAGGVGLATLGMMARISLGHTGRNVNKPPSQVAIVFVLVLISACVRVLGPLLLPDAYGVWIKLGQITWSAGFLLFVFVYFQILISARADGMRG